MERSDQIGRYGELLFVMEAIKRGFNVLYPDNVYGYDYVIEYEGKFTRVQIKTTNSINENRRYIWNITNKSLGSDVFVFIVICIFIHLFIHITYTVSHI